MRGAALRAKLKADGVERMIDQVVRHAEAGSLVASQWLVSQALPSEEEQARTELAKSRADLARQEAITQAILRDKAVAETERARIEARALSSLLIDPETAEKLVIAVGAAASRCLSEISTERYSREYEGEHGFNRLKVYVAQFVQNVVEEQLDILAGATTLPEGVAGLLGGNAGADEGPDDEDDT